MVGYKFSIFENAVNRALLAANTKLNTSFKFRYENFELEAVNIVDLKKLSGEQAFPLLFCPVPIFFKETAHLSLAAYDVSFFAIVPTVREKYAPERQATVFNNQLEPFVNEFLSQLSEDSSVLNGKFSDDLFDVKFEQLPYRDNNLNEIIDTLKFTIKEIDFKNIKTC